MAAEVSYNALLALSSAFTLALVLWGRYSSSKSAASNTTEAAAEEANEEDPRYHAFRNKYLAVYLLMVCGDWLQGPYVYSLYSKYGFSRQEIALLFVVGFGASMVVGTFVGSLADAGGRRKYCALYAVLYIASCCTKHFASFYVLLLGRLLGGVATSLLCSVFESWLVCESGKRHSPRLLSHIFALQTLGNSLVAITSGVVGQVASDALPLQELVSGVYWGGYTVPFDLASLVMMLGLGLMMATWEENYGSGDRQQQTGGGDSLAGLRQGVAVLRQNRAVLLCGLVQSLFEAAMYSFVFEWSPALTSTEEVPYGTIFATFMVCCMAGSQLVGWALIKRQPQDVLPYVFLVSAASLGLVPLQAYLPVPRVYGFLVFEMMVGMYYPLMGMLKSQIVPEQQRSTLYNLFRIPLNALVLFILLSKFPVHHTFAWCSALLVLAAYLQLVLRAELAMADKTKA